MFFKVIFKKEEINDEINYFVESRDIEELERKLRNNKFIKVSEEGSNREFLINVDEIRCIVPDEEKTIRELEKWRKEVEERGGNIFE